MRLQVLQRSRRFSTFSINWYVLLSFCKAKKINVYHFQICNQNKSVNQLVCCNRNSSFPLYRIFGRTKKSLKKSCTCRSCTHNRFGSTFKNFISCSNYIVCWHKKYWKRVQYSQLKCSEIRIKNFCDYKTINYNLVCAFTEVTKVNKQNYRCYSYDHCLK